MKKIFHLLAELNTNFQWLRRTIILGSVIRLESEEKKKKIFSKHDFPKKKKFKKIKKIHSNKKNIEVVSILPKIFSLSQQFTTVYMDRDVYNIFVNDDADFPDDDPEDDPDRVVGGEIHYVCRLRNFLRVPLNG